MELCAAHFAWRTSSFVCCSMPVAFRHGSHAMGNSGLARRNTGFFCSFELPRPLRTVENALRRIRANSFSSIEGQGGAEEATVAAGSRDYAGADSNRLGILNSETSQVRGIQDVIGKARSLDKLESLAHEDRQSSGRASVHWKVDERVKRSCEAGSKLRVAVLVSGGVDSSVALRLLCDAGHSCTAYYLKIWFQEDFENYWSACPWEEDLSFARTVCDEAGVELKVLHLTDAYWQKVVSGSLMEIQAGRTPNPDMLCNSQIKFGEFLEHIKDLQFDRVASGHYASVKRVRDDAMNQVMQLYLSPDEVKDQTYFLSQLSQSQLSRLMFPLGGLSKVEVREIAVAMGLANQQRRDSQGICFLGKEFKQGLGNRPVEAMVHRLRDYSNLVGNEDLKCKDQLIDLWKPATLSRLQVKFSEFIARHLGERQGYLLEAETGELLGTHKGFWFYTIGQRQGLRLANGPWFVVAKDVEHNVVFISRKYFCDKIRRSFRVGSFNWISGFPPSSLANIRCKVRHGPKFYDCQINFETSLVGEKDVPESSPQVPKDFATAVVLLGEDDQGLAPGQYSAFYQGDACLGSGIIVEALGDQFVNVSARALEIAKSCNDPQTGKALEGAKRVRGKVVMEGVEENSSKSTRSSKKTLEITSPNITHINLKTSSGTDSRNWLLTIRSKLFSWIGV